MEKTKKKINLEPVIIHPRGRNPSFSSTLLESIYRSIDQGTGDHTDKGHTTITLEEEMSMSLYKRDQSMRKNQLWSFKGVEGEDEKWMEKKKTSSMKVNKFSHAAAVLSNSNSNSSSSSSESSFWSGGLSSSDSESAHNYYGPKSRSYSSSCYSMQRPKPIRTERSSSHGPTPKPKNHHHHHHHDQDKATKMSKALKIYNELKKVKKQPISPGGKLSSFLNSLFNTHSKKNGLKPSKGFEEPSKSSNSSYVSTPNCSSASSYARSCLSKTPSSGANKLSNNGSKRSVRFSVIVDEGSRPCGQKNVQGEDDEMKLVRVMEENMKVVEAARKLLESYPKSKKESYGINGEVSEDEDDDDAMSCSSSDLFELNNLSDIGFTTRYSEELPVYETTHVDTNRAIAKGLIV